MHRYRVYGLNVHSEIELPELVTADESAELTIRFGSVEHLPEDADQQAHAIWVTDSETCLTYSGIGAFLIRNGNEIIMDIVPTVEERVIRLAVLGPSLSVALHQRGLLVLHSSAVAIAGAAVGFMAHSGGGKSSLAAALHARGHQVIADDLAVVQFNQNQKPALLPGFPQLKLWPEAAMTVGQDPDTLARLHPNMEKRSHKLREGFLDQPTPLRCLYILDEGPDIVITPLSGQNAFIELLRNSHDALLLEETHTAPQHLAQCATLVNTIAIRRLQRPWSLDAQPDIVKAIEDDLAALP